MSPSDPTPTYARNLVLAATVAGCVWWVLIEMIWSVP